MSLSKATKDIRRKMRQIRRDLVSQGVGATRTEFIVKAREWRTGRIAELVKKQDDGSYIVAAEVVQVLLPALFDECAEVVWRMEDGRHIEPSEDDGPTQLSFNGITIDAEITYEAETGALRTIATGIATFRQWHNSIELDARKARESAAAVRRKRQAYRELFALVDKNLDASIADAVRKALRDAA